MTFNRMVFFGACMLLWTMAHSIKVGEYVGSHNSPELSTYKSGPLPYRQLKKAGFDVSHTLRQMESPSPEPTPSPKCEPEKKAVEEACTLLETSKTILEKRCEKVRRWEKLLKDIEKLLKEVCAEIKDLKKRLDSYVRTTVTDMPSQVEVHIRQGGGFMQDVQERLDLLEQLKDDCKLKMEEAETELSTEKTLKAEAAELVDSMKDLKRSAQSALTACLQGM